MKRALLLSVLAVLLWQAEAWTRNNPVPAGEHTFEASRTGFQPIETAGPLTREDFVRLLLRRAGDFRIPLTVNYRVWRRAEPPNLWELDLPGAIKVDVGPDRVVATDRQGPDVMGAGTVFNQPLLVRNTTGKELDVQVVARFGQSRLAERFQLTEGLNYYSLNLLPETQGQQQLSISFSAGEESTPQADLWTAQINRLVEVAGWGTLQLNTVEHGEPVHARVTAYAADGLAYAPSEGTLSKLTWTAGEPFFYSTGSHALRLPAGVARIRVVRGFEYTPVEQEVQIQPGAARTLTIPLERFSNLAQDGWYGADVHIHANYNDREFITPQDVQIQALGEDLNIAHLMVANSTGAQIHDAAYFEGRPHRLSTPNHLLYWIEEMRNAGLYGHMCLPGIQRLVEPLYTGFPGTPQPYDYPPNYFQAKGAQAAGGVASYAHPGYSFTDDPATMSASELPVDLALGVIEAMDVLSNSNELAAVPYWYKLLNTGLHCAISAGSDSFTNRRHHWLPGGQRVFAYTGPGLDYRRWVEAYRQGKSFASNGPLLKFTLDGQLPGATLDVTAGRKLTASASVTSLVELDALELVVNGEVVASAPGPARELSLAHEITLKSGAWVAARARGPYDPLLVNDDNAFAHSSPIYCLVNGQTVHDPEAAQFFVTWIDKLIARVQRSERFANEEQRRETIALFRQAQTFYRSSPP